MQNIEPSSHALLPPFDERLRRLLDRAAAEVRVSRTAVERSAAYLETARRLLAGRPMADRGTSALTALMTSAPSRLHTSSRSRRRAKPGPARSRTGRRPSSGTRLPCTRTGCRGTMQFGREVVQHGETLMMGGSSRAWVCSERAQHVHLSRAAAASPRVAGLVARTRWEDDGGSRK
jgi:hypothetical protein